MTKPISPAPQTQKPKSAVRMPQRSQEVSGDEQHEVPKPIAAARDKGQAKSR